MLSPFRFLAKKKSVKSQTFIFKIFFLLQKNREMTLMKCSNSFIFPLFWMIFVKPQLSPILTKVVYEFFFAIKKDRKKNVLLPDLFEILSFEFWNWFPIKWIISKAALQSHNWIHVKIQKFTLTPFLRETNVFKSWFDEIFFPWK